MFFHLSNDPDNCVFIKPLLAPTFEIVTVLDKDANEIEGSDKLDTTQKHTYLIGGEEYTYVASHLSNEATEVRWCFWVEGKDDKLSKSYFEIKKTDLKKEGNNFFLTSDSCEENTKQLEENAILSAKFVEEEHLVDGVEKKVDVLKVRFSKWLDTEKINVEVYKYNLVENKGKPTGNSSSGDGFHFSAQKTVKSIYLAARPTAWKAKNNWTETYVKGFNAFAEEEFLKMVDQAKKDKKPNRLNSYDCADLAVTLYIKYAAKHQLPVTFTSNRNGTDILDPQKTTYITGGGQKKEFSEDPEKALAEFIESVRANTGAASLVRYKDLVPLSIKNDLIDGKLYGAVHDSGTHVKLITSTEPNNKGEYNVVQSSLRPEGAPNSFARGAWLGEGWIYSDIYHMTIQKEDHKFIYTFKEMQKRNLKIEIIIPDIPKKEIKLFENVKVEPKKPKIN